MKEHDFDLPRMGRDAASAAKQQTNTTLTGAKLGAGRPANEASEAADTLAELLSGSGQENLRRAVGALSSQLEKLAVYLEQRSLDDLARDAQRTVRRNPALFVAGGLAVSRFFKARTHTGRLRASQTDRARAHELET